MELGDMEELDIDDFFDVEPEGNKKSNKKNKKNKSKMKFKNIKYKKQNQNF